MKPLFWRKDYVYNIYRFKDVRLEMKLPKIPAKLVKLEIFFLNTKLNVFKLMKLITVSNTIVFPLVRSVKTVTDWITLEQGVSRFRLPKIAWFKLLLTFTTPQHKFKEQLIFMMPRTWLNSFTLVKNVQQTILEYNKTSLLTPPLK